MPRVIEYEHALIGYESSERNVAIASCCDDVTLLFRPQVPMTQNKIELLALARVAVEVMALQIFIDVSAGISIKCSTQHLSQNALQSRWLRSCLCRAWQAV